MENLYDLKCLSLDGGGIRAVMQGYVLKALPKIHYDYIAGTSAGAINACLLAMGFDADDIINFYAGEEGKKIFDPYLFNTPFAHKSKYDSKNINEVLLNKLGNFKLKDVKTSLIIPTYNILTRKVIIFTNLDKNQGDYYLRDVAACSAAAPYYFTPHEFGKYENEDGISKFTFCCVDGGLARNNPSEVLYSIIKNTCNNPLIVSLGTGTFEVPLKLNGMCYTSNIKFLENLIDSFMDANSDSTDTVMKGILGKNYVRFQPPITKDTCQLDNTSDKNMKTLEDLVKEYLINDCIEKLAVLKFVR